MLREIWNSAIGQEKVREFLIILDTISKKNDRKLKTLTNVSNVLTKELKNLRGMLYSLYNIHV